MTSVTKILQAVEHIVVPKAEVDPQFVVFPLFIAGYAASEPEKKDLALNMIKAVEQHSFGGCTQSVRGLLEVVYEKQRAAVLMNESTFVDWVHEMEVRGYPPIIYGI